MGTVREATLKPHFSLMPAFRSHLVAAVCAVYLFGRYRFHWSWLLAALWLLHHADARRRSREEARARQDGRDARELELQSTPAVRWLNEVGGARLLAARTLAALEMATRHRRASARARALTHPCCAAAAA
jgi:hypothetical protein